MAKAASTPALVRPADLAAVRQLLKEWTLDTYLCSKPPSTVVTLSDDMTIGQVDGVLVLFVIAMQFAVHILACIHPHLLGLGSWKVSVWLSVK